MFYWSGFLLIITVTAGFLGFGGVAGAWAGIAQVFFYIVLVIFAVVLVMHLAGRG